LVTIGDDFGSLSNINWIALAYTLCDLGCAVMFTSMSDVFGRRNAYIVAFILFFSASIGCGFARSTNQLIALRSVQGIGGSGLYSLAMVMFPEIFPRSMRKWIGAVAGGVVGTSGILGPILGGIITHFASWKWIFWLKSVTPLFNKIQCANIKLQRANWRHLNHNVPSRLAQRQSTSTS
jgi:MFS family permease